MAARQLIFLTVVMVVLLYVFNIFIKNHGSFEGFLDLPGRNEGQQRFNDVMNLVNITNPQLPLNTSTETRVNQATVTPGYQGGLPGAFQQTGTVNEPYKIPTGGSGSGIDTAKTVCEVVKTSDCNAFNNPQFAEKCGISFDLDGIDSQGNKHIGGMYVSPDDRQRLKSDKLPIIPTLGTAKQGLFAGDKEECIAISEQLACEKNRVIGEKNCTQCFTSGDYNRVDPRTPRVPPKIVITSSANEVLFNYQGQIKKINTKGGSWAELSIPDVKEGYTFTLNAEGDPATLFIAGYLTGDTQSNSMFAVDLKSLAQIDRQTLYGPRLAGTRDVNGVTCFVMRPGLGKKLVQIQFTLPYSFIAPMEKESMKCSNGPVISTAASADFLANDPCYGKNSKPGSYGLPCLQQLFVSMGGTTSGNGYPKDDASARKILFDTKGAPRSLTDIGNFLYDMNVRAATGKDSTGKSLSISDWNFASMFCTGTIIESACDGDNKESGPLSRECLIYLYNNEGAGKREGPTYTSAPLTLSLNKELTQALYCRPEGRLNPSTDEGFKRGRAAGGVNAVKQLYDKAHATAMDNKLSNDARKDAILDCFGDTLLRQEPEVYYVGGYDYTKDQAEGVCKSFGGRVATTQDVKEAQRGGADWCATGWVSDNPTPLYPITSLTQGGCGNGSPGIKFYMPPSNKAGVNCFGPKPDIKNKGKVAEFAPGVWLRANATVLPTSSAPQCNWNQTTGGFIEGGGATPNAGGGCFSGLSLEAAKASCCSNPACDGFSFSTDTAGNGCFKNGNAGFRSWQGYNGYRKA
jgi:hypothetical protein